MLFQINFYFWKKPMWTRLVPILQMLVFLQCSLSKGMCCLAAIFIKRLCLTAKITYMWLDSIWIFNITVSYHCLSGVAKQCIGYFNHSSLLKVPSTVLCHWTTTQNNTCIFCIFNNSLVWRCIRMSTSKTTLHLNEHL